MLNSESPTNHAAAPRRRVPGLDGVRAVAALAVLVTHAGFLSGTSLRDGFIAGVVARLDFGVTVFFLLSGFVIYRPFITAVLSGRSRPAILGFYWRRAIRILPAYWLAVSITLAALTTRPPSRADWLSYLFLVQTFDHHNVDSSLSQMWTLNTEVSFYIALPLLAWLLALTVQRARAAIRASIAMCFPLVLIGIAMCWRVVTSSRPGLSLSSMLWLPAQLDWFALGMLLATASVLARSSARPGGVRTLQAWAAQSGASLTIGVAVFLIATLPLAGPRSLLPATTGQAETKHLLYGVSAFFLLLPLTVGRESAARTVLSWAPLVWLGEISYGIYLWHLPVLILIQERLLGYPTFSGHFWQLTGLTALASILVASLSYYCLERPILRRWSASGSAVLARKTAAIPARQTS